MLDQQEVSPASQPLRFLEREAEIGALQSLLSAARAGDGRLVVVEGAAGIGKTRLLAVARELAALDGFVVLAARAGELESGFAFGLVRQLFDAPLATLPADERAQVLAGAAALAAPLFAAPPPGAVDGGSDSSFAVLHGLYWLVANLAARSPTVLVVDDLHWADAPSLRWFAFLAHRLEGLPLLLLVGSRPPEQADHPILVDAIFGDPARVAITPRALGRESVAVLARERLGIEPADGFAVALHSASGGNPLFLSALLDAVAVSRMSPTADQAAAVLALGPHAVSRAVARRVARLGNDAGTLLHAAAILGDGTSLSLVAALAALDPRRALTAVTALLGGELLSDGDPVQFSHPVVRSAVLRSLDVGERLRAHRRAAELLLEQGAHVEQAAGYLVDTLPDGDPFVVRTLRDAAIRVTAQGSSDAAVSYLRRALAEPPAPGEQLDVLHELANAELNSGDMAGVERLCAVVASLDDRSERPELTLACARALIYVGRTLEAVEVLRGALEGANAVGERMRWRLEGHLIIAAQHDPELQSLSARQTAASMKEDIPYAAGASLLLGALANALARSGEGRTEAIAFAERALASSALEPVDAPLAVMHALYGLTAAGRFEQAATAYSAAIDHAQRKGDMLGIAVLQLFRASLRHQQGQLLAAEEDLRPVGPAADQDGPNFRAYRAAYLSLVLLERDELDEASALISAPVNVSAAGNRLFLQYSSGCVHLAAGRADAALSELLAVGTAAAQLGVQNPAWLPWRSAAALALRRVDRPEEARAMAHDELRLARSWGAPRAIGVALRTVAALADGTDTIEHLREAVTELAGACAELEHAHALVDLGAALRRANSRRDARPHLREGVELANRCGAAALVTRGNAELAATGARPRSVMLTGRDELTVSERRVAQLAAGGLTNRDIAQTLFVTVKTVELHLSRSYRKLDITSRKQLDETMLAPSGAS
jgi:DNA-binding NarL/FixJ family response regulator